jgi:hypothetical protein
MGGCMPGVALRDGVCVAVAEEIVEISAAKARTDE